MPGFSSMKPMQYSSSVPAGSRQLNNHSSGALLANESAEALIGRKVWTRWPEDNSFYEAVIKNYDSIKACLSLKKLPQKCLFWTYFYLCFNIYLDFFFLMHITSSPCLGLFFCMTFSYFHCSMRVVILQHLPPSILNLINISFSLQMHKWFSYPWHLPIDSSEISFLICWLLIILCISYTFSGTACFGLWYKYSTRDVGVGWY